MKKGWQTKTIGDVCEFQRGLTYAKGDEVDVSDNVVLRATNIDLATNLLIFDELKYINDKVVVPESKKVKKGSLMICTASGSKSHLGKVAFIDDDYGYAFGGFMGMLTPLNGLSPRYLFHLMTSEDYKDFIGALSDGANINNLTFDNLKRFPVPVPPLAEQQRIVGLLDEAFEGLATAKANAEKNLQNARALFESHLQSVFTQRGKRWVDRTLDQVCIVERGSSPRPIKEYFTTEPDGVNWIKIGDTEEGGKYVYSTGQKITPEGAKQSRFVKEGDFILTNSLSYGRPYIMKTSGYIHDGWFVLRLNMAIDTDYFYYLLSSPVVQLQFASLASGSVVKNISGDLVKKAVLPIPPLEHQHIIVEKLLALEEETQRLESIYKQKLAALDALKKSLLHKAFSGQL